MQSEPTLVLGVTRHNFKDDNGREVKGVNVYTIQADYRDEEDVRGFIPAKFSGDHTAFQDFQELPGYYDLLLIHRASQGKMVARVKAATFVGPAEIAASTEGLTA